MSIVRPAELSDRLELARLRHALWPEGSLEEHEKEIDAILAGDWSPIYPYAIFVTDGAEARPVGFVEVTLRSRADGCDPSRPVGYLEGWYVAESSRRRGHGSDLLRAAEDWARRQGCREMASDTWVDSSLSQRVHEALGFEVVDRVVNYRKAL